MILVITEKPSVANDLSTVFQNKKSDGFIECQENSIFQEPVVISWAFGHLLTIENEFPKNIELNNLPVTPDFRYKPIDNPGAKKQLNTLVSLIKKANKIVIATDSGREGELIGRLILNHAKWTNWNNTFRFWTSEALTPEVIRKTFSNLSAASKYDGLYQSSLARQHSDWILGLNLSACTSKSSGGWYSIGRVQTPTLKLIVDRYNSIANFKQTKFFTVDLDFSQNNQNYSGTLIQDDPEEYLSEEKASEILNSISSFESGEVTFLEEKEEKKNPPLLHSLTSLQREANESFGYSASETLQMAQDLYEKYKSISYPRTDSNYMSESSVELVCNTIDKLGIKCNDPRSAGKRVFDDSKLTDHYAIIPLSKLSDSAPEQLRNIYNLILRRFHGVFLNPAIYLKSAAITTVERFQFKTTGTKIISAGYQELYPVKKNENEKIFPNLNKGRSEIIKRSITPKQTEPPKQHTDSSILKIMEKLGLGTPATRADILEKLLNSKRSYLVRNKKNLIPTEKGIELIQLVSNRNFANPDLTSEWEIKLSSIAINETNYDSFMTDLVNFTRSEIQSISSMKFTASSSNENKPATKGMIEFAKSLTKQHGFKLENNSFDYIKMIIDEWSKKEVQIGACKCGEQIKESKAAFYCSACNRSVWKSAYGRTFNQKEAFKLLNDETITANNCVKKDGTSKYSAVIGFEQNKISIINFLNSKK